MRKLVIFLAVVGVLLVSFAGGVAARWILPVIAPQREPTRPPAEGIVEAREFRLVDDEGKLRAVLAVSKGSGSLKMYDREEKVFAGIGRTTDETGEMTVAARERHACGRHECSVFLDMIVAEAGRCVCPLFRLTVQPLCIRHFLEREEEHLKTHDVIVAVWFEPGAVAVVKDLW